MKNFDHRAKGQLGILTAVGNTDPGKAANLHGRIEFFAVAYRQYILHRGNPWLMTGYVPDPVFLKAMTGFYRGRMGALEFIGDLRDDTQGTCCAMCGSLNSHQIDHFLPRVHYPEFAVFLPNLFPICSCNQSKGNKTIGPNPGERFLHPAFDRRLGERSLFVRIRHHDDVPKYIVAIRKPKGVDDAAAFAFHTEKLVSQRRLRKYVRREFERFCRRPCSVVRAFENADPVDKADLVRHLSAELRESCKAHRSKNNWESVFLHALLERRTLAWIWKRMSEPGRVGGEPLVDL